jgi:hypothetical protein
VLTLVYHTTARGIVQQSHSIVTVVPLRPAYAPRSAGYRFVSGQPGDGAKFAYEVEVQPR